MQQVIKSGKKQIEFDQIFFHKITKKWESKREFIANSISQKNTVQQVIGKFSRTQYSINPNSLDCIRTGPCRILRASPSHKKFRNCNFATSLNLAIRYS